MTGIPYQAKEIALRKMEHMTEEYVQVNPLKKVPVIDDSGFILTERYFEEKKMIVKFIENFHFSVAILSYLSDKHKKADWYPTELQKRARVNEYNNWQHLNLRANGSMLFQTKVENDQFLVY
jgi:glutathione S-transferase